MLLTRTIRRKLLLGLGIVLAMLVFLAAGSLLGLSAYKQSIRELEFEISEAPQRMQLIEQIARLQFPLRRTPRDVIQARIQRELLLEQSAAVRESLHDFHRRCDSLPGGPDLQRQLAVMHPMLTRLEEQLDLQIDRTDALEELEGRAERVSELQSRAVEMLSQAIEIPDPVDSPARSLARAKRVYRTASVTVAVSASICLLLFLFLLRQGYVWIFDPIRQLHQGALRVAHGDFDYRVRLKTRDEMAELAEAFNQMTARFQESPVISTARCRNAAGSWSGRSGWPVLVFWPPASPTRSTIPSRPSPWPLSRWNRVSMKSCLEPTRPIANWSSNICA